MKLLLIANDPIFCRELLKVFIKNRYQVDIANDGKTGFYLLNKSIYDLLILDFMLPDISGIDFLKKIQHDGTHTMVIFLSVKDNMEDKIEAFDYGADDYLCKPFAIEELLIRIRSLLRRTQYIQRDNCLCINNLELNLDMYEVYLGNETFRLTEKETEIFALLIRNANKFVSKEKIINTIWGVYKGIEPGNVEIYIHRLRRKPFYKKSGIIIETRRGVGYRLREETDSNRT